MLSILLLTMTLSLSMSAPFSIFDLKRPTDTGAYDKMIPDTTGKLLTIVKKNFKPNSKEETTFLVSEEFTVLSSTGYPTFDAFDQNSDGFIEFEEFAATDGKDHKNSFQSADTNGDLKLSPEEFSQLSVVVYEPEQFSDSDSDEPPLVFLTPPESITRFSEKDSKLESDTTFEDYKDIPVFVSTIKEETKDDKDVTEDTKKEDNNEDIKLNIKTEIQKEEKKSDKTETSDAKEGSHFTAEDMPVKIDDEDDEEMIDVKDEDIPMEVMDDLNDDNHYNDLEERTEPQEDDKQMNDQLNSVE